MKPATPPSRHDNSRAGERPSATAFALHRSVLYLVIAAGAINLMFS